MAILYLRVKESTNVQFREAAAETGRTLGGMLDAMFDPKTRDDITGFADGMWTAYKILKISESVDEAMTAIADYMSDYRA